MADHCQQVGGQAVCLPNPRAGCPLALTFFTPRVSVTTYWGVPIELGYALEIHPNTDTIFRSSLHDKSVGCTNFNIRIAELDSYLLTSHSNIT